MSIHFACQNLNSLFCAVVGTAFKRGAVSRRTEYVTSCLASIQGMPELQDTFVHHWVDPQGLLNNILNTARVKIEARRCHAPCSCAHARKCMPLLIGVVLIRCSQPTEDGMSGNNDDSSDDSSDTSSNWNTASHSLERHTRPSNPPTSNYRIDNLMTSPLWPIEPTGNTMLGQHHFDTNIAPKLQLYAADNGRD